MYTFTSHHDISRIRITALNAIRFITIFNLSAQTGCKKTSYVVVYVASSSREKPNVSYIFMVLPCLRCVPHPTIIRIALFSTLVNIIPSYLYYKSIREWCRSHDDSSFLSNRNSFTCFAYQRVVSWYPSYSSSSSLLRTNKSKT